MSIYFVWPLTHHVIIIQKDRGCEEALTAGAKKEILFLTKIGKPAQPFRRLRREIYDYRLESPLCAYNDTGGVSANRTLSHTTR